MYSAVRFIGDDVGVRMQELRDEISRRAMARALPPEHQSILAEVVAKRTADRLVEWSAHRDVNPMFSWVDSVLRDHPQQRRLYGLLSSTVSAALDVLSEEMSVPPRLRFLLSDLQQRIDVRVGAYCVENQDNPLQAVDPIDARIDELLLRLSTQDTLTAEHSRSVGMWCWRVANKLNLSRSDAYLVTRSGLLHDVGKTLTPVDILTAARGLSEDEWIVMRRHSAEGEQIVLQSSELHPFAPAVRSHHERFDGRGYPDGLERGSIAFAARVVSVADAFNAMIARRPYRAPLPPTHAIEELKRNSGTQFDPAVVEAMIEVVLSGG